MMLQSNFAFMHYCPSDKVGYPHFLHFKAKEPESTYRLYAYISNDASIELSVCAYTHERELTPYQVERFKDKEAYHYLLPILQRERLRIMVDGFSIKPLLERYSFTEGEV